MGGHHEAAVSQVAGQVGPHLVQVSISDGCFCAGPQELVGVHQGGTRGRLLRNSMKKFVIFIVILLIHKHLKFLRQSTIAGKNLYSKP